MTVRLKVRREIRLCSAFKRGKRTFRTMKSFFHGVGCQTGLFDAWQI